MAGVEFYVCFQRVHCTNFLLSVDECWWTSIYKIKCIKIKFCSSTPLFWDFSHLHFSLRAASAVPALVERGARSGRRQKSWESGCTPSIMAIKYSNRDMMGKIWKTIGSIGKLWKDRWITVGWNGISMNFIEIPTWEGKLQFMGSGRLPLGMCGSSAQF